MPNYPDLPFLGMTPRPGDGKLVPCFEMDEYFNSTEGYNYHAKVWRLPNGKALYNEAKYQYYYKKYGKAYADQKVQRRPVDIKNAPIGPRSYAAERALTTGITAKMPEEGKMQTLDSREVAKQVGKRHDNLARDIAGYVKNMENSIDLKIEVNDFFIETTYKDSTGRTLPCYLITKKGCEFIAHKLTGQKGTEFTAFYINRFHDMEQALVEPQQPTTHQLPDAASMRARAMLMNAQTRQIKLLKDTLPADQISKVALRVLELKTFEAVTGTDMGNLLPGAEVTYSATEVAEILSKELGWSITAHRIGVTANNLGIKTDEHGKKVWDKARHSNKEVPTFRYNEKGLDALRKALTPKLTGQTGARAQPQP